MPINVLIEPIKVKKKKTKEHTDNIFNIVWFSIGFNHIKAPLVYLIMGIKKKASRTQ
jgi:hypothetical protein